MAEELRRKCMEALEALRNATRCGYLAGVEAGGLLVLGRALYAFLRAYTAGYYAYLYADNLVSIIVRALGEENENIRELRETLGMLRVLFERALEELRALEEQVEAWLSKLRSEGCRVDEALFGKLLDDLRGFTRTAEKALSRMSLESRREIEALVDRARDLLEELRRLSEEAMDRNLAAFESALDELGERCILECVRRLR